MGKKICSWWPLRRKPSHPRTSHGVCVLPAGLSISDRAGSQPIGIVLTIIGVVVLDFCADSSEGPIRAYLLDVADAEEQDMALNIHAFSAGKTPKTHRHVRQRSSVCSSTPSNKFTANYTMQLFWLQVESKLVFIIIIGKVN